MRRPAKSPAMRRLAAILLAATAAGCLSTPGADLDAAKLEAPLWEAVRARIGPLPCEATVGEGTSDNLVELALDPLDDAGEGSHGELAVSGTLAAIARYQTGGFDLVDITDPLAPRQLAAWDPEEADRSLDVKFSPDGATLLVGGDRAITLVDVREPAAPKVESVYRLAKPQAHMLTVFEVDGASYVAAAKGEGYDLAIYRIAGEAGARTLEPVAKPRLTRLGETTGEDLLRSHDAWFAIDVMLQKPVLWVANVWDGIVALDVSDPAAPQVISRIAPLDPYQGYTHTVQATFVDGRRLVVAVQEVGANALKVYDATDLEEPTLVALWHVPVVAKPQHNLQLVGAHAFVAHYDEGTYVLDLAEAGAGPFPTRLAPIARLAAIEGTASAPSAPQDAFRGTWDVVVHNGLLLTSEIAHGLRVTGFGCLEAGEAALSSTG